MLEIEAELKSLKLYGMAQVYAEIAEANSTRLQTAEWVLVELLRAESEDRHLRSIRYQLQSAKFPHHRDLATALGISAVTNCGHRVRFYSVIDLVTQLERKRSLNHAIEFSYKAL